MKSRHFYRNLDGTTQGPDGTPIPWDPTPIPWDWSDTNLPWAHTPGTEPWLDVLEIPPHIPRVPLASGANLRAAIDATVARESGPFVLQLEEGNYEFDHWFNPRPGVDPEHACMMYWDPTGKLAGILGRGPLVTSVGAKANSMHSALKANLATLTYGGPTVAQTTALRIDHHSEVSKPGASHGVHIGGLTFRGADQGDINLDASFPTTYFEPRPAPWIGLRPYVPERNITRISHVRFQAFGHVVSSQPPFEAAQLSHKNSLDHKLMNAEFDGRLSSVYNPNRPRRGTIWQMNDEAKHHALNVWGHHTALTRYAASDENNNAKGLTILERSKLEQITNTRNSGDPAYNNGGSLGGWTDASCVGYESMAGDLRIVDSLLCMDNPYTDSGQKPMHLQWTTPYGAVRTGGKFTMTGTICRSSGQPQMDGWVTGRVDQDTQWYTEGMANRIFIYHPETGVRLTAHPYTGAWPPNLAALEAQGITKNTHWIAQLI